MGYMGDGLPNWHYDRQRRVRLFDRLKSNHKPNLDGSKKPKFEEESVVRKPKKYDWILPLLGAILKIGFVLLIFYSFAMILSHGKYWP